MRNLLTDTKFIIYLFVFWLVQIGHMVGEGVIDAVHYFILINISIAVRNINIFMISEEQETNKIRLDMPIILSLLSPISSRQYPRIY